MFRSVTPSDFRQCLVCLRLNRLHFSVCYPSFPSTYINSTLPRNLLRPKGSLVIPYASMSLREEETILICLLLWMEGKRRTRNRRQRRIWNYIGVKGRDKCGYALSFNSSGVFFCSQILGRL